MIEQSLFRGTKWVAFENNDEPTWARLPEPSAEDPDVIVSGGGCPGLLAGRARLKVLGIDDSGRACLYELREHAVLIGDVSPDKVVEAIRAHAGSSA